MMRIDDSDLPTRNSVLDMLRTICPEADLAVDPDGTVRVKDAQVCTEEFYQAHRSCRCICHLIMFDRTVTIRVNAARAAVGNGGMTVDANEDDTANGTGSDETVFVDNRFRFAEPDWIILAHELCGHALPGMRGNHPEWRPGRPGFTPDWHKRAIEAENEVRRGHGLPPR